MSIYYGRTNGLFPGDLGAVESLVTPAPVYNCHVIPGYDPVNGMITFTVTLADCS